jgi:hypothetical protein
MILKHLLKSRQVATEEGDVIAKSDERVKILVLLAGEQCFDDADAASSFSEDINQQDCQSRGLGARNDLLLVEGYSQLVHDDKAHNG